MPGPSSRATTRMPRRPWPSRTSSSSTSPRTAYAVMLRATSEIAVASRVWSVLGMSSPTASARARWRAVTTSASERIAIRSAPSWAKVARLLPGLEQGEALLEVEGRLHVLEAHPELDHRERHLRLDPDDHRLRAAQARHHRDAPQRARHERVHHVER